MNYRLVMAMRSTSPVAYTSAHQIPHVLFSLDLERGRADFVLGLARELRNGHAGCTPRLVAEFSYERSGDAAPISSETPGRSRRGTR